ncbi:MAG: binding-protein-dependent transport system inner rane component [Thermomicrobiales bacterium]|jgi:raffinose/stachyose/melibiose transport system permease protein|nr:binding-protein-dependent transport system inner rane component [Thermomicrobiales bacterium]MDF3016165.1 binding-protein-dependent transport system inner rane component [Thermomicrobiales bacterium]
MSAIVPSSRARREETLAPNYIVLALLLVFAIGPLLVLAFNSLKTQAELGRNPLGPPQSFMWENFPKAWDMGNFAMTTRNSGILVVGTVIGVLLLGGMAAYSLAKLDLPGSGPLTLYLLIGTSLPIQLYLVPLYFTWNRLGLVNNLFGLVVIYIATNAPFAVFLLRSYMVQLPRDFEDAARVDGAGEWQVFSRIVVPLSWPGFLTVGLVVALSVWNEFLMATVFLTDQDLFTVVTSYNNFAQRFSRDWTMTSAAAVMMILPVIIIFLSLQRRFIEGLTQGGLKG